MTEEKKEDPSWKGILSGDKQLTQEQLDVLLKDLTTKYSNSSYMWPSYPEWVYRPRIYQWNTCLNCGKKIGSFYVDRCLCPWNQPQQYKWYYSPTEWVTGTSGTSVPPKPAEEEDEEDEEDEKPIPTGWLCPICQNVYAPSVLKCPEC